LVQLVDKKSVINHGGFEKFKNVKLDEESSKSVDIYIEKRFLEDLKNQNEVKIDLKTWKRYGKQMSSLSLKKGAIS